MREKEPSLRDTASQAGPWREPWTPNHKPTLLPSSSPAVLIIHMGISLKIFFEMGSGHRGACSLSSSSLTKTYAVPLPAIPY